MSQGPDLAPDSNFIPLLPEVLGFWFDGAGEDRPFDVDGPVQKRWYGKDPDIDADIRARFEPGYRALARAVPRGWRPADEGQAVAAVIVLDQLPRNMYRGTPAMYASDHLALELAREAAARDPLDRIDLFHAHFLFMPLMHAENLADQELMLALFRRMAELAHRRAPHNAAFFDIAYDFAVRHHEIIARFGRFPHRNAILGRTSTPEEEAFLQKNGSSF